MKARRAPDASARRTRTPGARLVLAGEFLLLVGIGAVLLHLSYAPARGRQEARSGGTEFIRGDADDDGQFNLTDAVFTLNFLFLGGDEIACEAAADVNDDGAIDVSDPIRTLNFLFLGYDAPPSPYPDPGVDPTPDLGCGEPPIPPLPDVGSAGGPDRELDPDEELDWRRGRDIFRAPATHAEGLGPIFNGDSCVACHLDPVVGGSGGVDVDVVRFARVDDQVVTHLEGGPVVSRHSVLALPREECPETANLIETRQTPTLLGLGLVDRLPEAAILANADPADMDGDGISGRARLVGEPGSQRVGRFGHKAGVPSLLDFTADALFNEVGVTVDPALTVFAVGADTDRADDPEMAEGRFLDLVFFVSHLAPPARRLPSEPDAIRRIEDGERIFGEIGCASCHVPALDGAEGPVPAYSDFLLHDVADPARQQVNEPGVEPREFRTAPLWGLRDTGPWLHDGSAETLRDAILDGHHGEAASARDAFIRLSSDEKTRLEEFLRSL